MMSGSVRRLMLIALLAIVGVGFAPGNVMAQVMPVDPVILEPVRPLFSSDGDEVVIPTVGVGCGQLSLAPLIFGLPALLLMSFCGSKESSYKRDSD